MDDIDRLAVELYEAMFDDDALRGVPRRLSALCEAETAMLFAREPGGPRVLAHNLFEDFERLYAERYHEVDPRLQIRGLVPGRAYEIDRFVPPSEWRESEIHNELAHPNGYDAEHCIGAGLGRVDNMPGPGGVVGLHRSARAGPFPPEATARLQAVLPHLARAFTLRLRLQQAETRASLAEETLDRLEVGVARLDGQGAVLYANRAAERIFAAGDGLSSTQGRLETEDRGAGRKLQTALAAAAHRTDELGGVVQVPRPSGAPAYIALIAPLSAAQDQVLVLVHDGEAACSDLTGRLSGLFGLTRAEAELAAALCEGKSLKDIAETRAVKMSTVRTQAQMVLDKTGVSRQAELVALVARTPHVAPAAL